MHAYPRPGPAPGYALDHWFASPMLYALAFLGYTIKSMMQMQS